QCGITLVTVDNMTGLIVSQQDIIVGVGQSVSYTHAEFQGVAFQGRPLSCTLTSLSCNQTHECPGVSGLCAVWISPAGKRVYGDDNSLYDYALNEYYQPICQSLPSPSSPPPPPPPPSGGYCTYNIVTGVTSGDIPITQPVYLPLNQSANVGTIASSSQNF